MAAKYTSQFDAEISNEQSSEVISQMSSISLSQANDLSDPISSDSADFKIKKGKLRQKQDKLDKKKKKKNKLSKLVETEAEETSQDESDHNQQKELSKKEQEKYRHLYQPKKNKADFVQNMERKYKREEEDHEGEDIEVADDNTGMIDDDFSPPDPLKDAKFWRIGCNRGKEIEAATQIMYKYQHLQTTETPLDIVSCFALKKFPAVVFIEAVYEASVQRAIEEIQNIRQNGFSILESHEIKELFTPIEIGEIDLKDGQWVRIKSHNIYQGDLAKIMIVEKEKRTAKVKLVPREKREIYAFKDDQAQKSKQKNKFAIKQEMADEIDGNINEEPETFGKKSRFFKSKKNQMEQKKFVRGPKIAIKIPNLAPTEDEKDSKFFYASTRDEWSSAKKDGFVIMKTNVSNLITNNIRPTLEELSFFYPDVKNFKSIIQKEHSNLKPIIEQQSDIKIGDYVWADGMTIKLRVKEIQSDGKVTLERTILQGDIRKIYLYNSEISKLKLAFSRNDAVQVVRGPHKGTCGVIIEMNSSTAQIVTESNQVIEILLSDLIQDKSKNIQPVNNTSQEFIVPEQKSDSELRHQDLIRFGQIDQDIGCILSISNQDVTVLDIGNNKRVINRMSIINKFNTRNHVTNNKHGNELRQGDQIIILEGFYKNKKAAILHVYKDYIFLFNGDFSKTNGVIIEKANNCGLMSSNTNLQKVQQERQQSREPIQQDKLIQGRDDSNKNLLGQHLMITKGQWAGYKGLVTVVQPQAITIQLDAKNLTVKVAHDQVNIKDHQGGSSLAIGKTPHHAPGQSTRVWDDLDNNRSVAHGFQSPYVNNFQTPMR